MKKTIYLLLFACTFAATAQINESFDEGVPSNWGEWSENFISWQYNTDFGSEALGCVMVYNAGSVASKTRLETPFVDVSNFIDPEINFSVALIKNNFLAPSAALLYDVGDGWIELKRWNGDGDENPINSTFNPEMNLSDENVSWVDLNYNLSALTSETSIRFAIQADIHNGGWVLMDDINMTNHGLVNLSTNEQMQEAVMLYPNPTNGNSRIKADPLRYNKLIVNELSGKEIMAMEIRDSETILNLEQLAKGIYLVSLYKGDDLLLTEKIMIE